MGTGGWGGGGGEGFLGGGVFGGGEGGWGERGYALGPFLKFFLVSHFMNFQRNFSVFQNVSMILVFQILKTFFYISSHV